MARGRDEGVLDRTDSAGAARRASPPAFAWQDTADHHGAGNAERSLPGLHREERLPWLNADDDAEAGLDPGRVWAVVLIALAMLLVIAGGLWWTLHRREANTRPADGSLIAAPPGPIKVAPQDPGGKTFDGTGDSSFAVSQGHIPGATLAGGDRQDGGAAAQIVPPAPTADPAHAPAAGPSGAIVVQLGAFSTQPAAEAAWAHLAKTYDALSGSAHRIVAGKADIGTVYDLQAIAGSDAAATALCDRLKTAGLNCQVKD